MAIRAAAEIDDGLVLALMRFGADLLKYPCPTTIPPIKIVPDADYLGRIEWGWFTTVIKLKHWRTGNLFDQSVLLHELVHHCQEFNGVAMTGNVFEGRDETEIEALTVQCRWLKSVGEDPREYISQRTIFRLTGDADFARLNWM